LDGSSASLDRLEVAALGSYSKTTICWQGRKKTVSLHAMVCLAFNGPKPGEAYQVAHYDGNPSNNHCSNLRWATAKENAEDRERLGVSARGLRNGAYTKPERRPRGDQNGARTKPWSRLRGDAHRVVHAGCSPKGVDHHASKISAEQALEIRNDSRSSTVLAREYGLHFGTIQRIRTGKTWAHI
jgi:hypothetical protein